MRGRLLILAAAALWGTTGTAQAIGPDSATPLGVGALRIVTGGIILGLIAGMARRSRDLGWLRHPATLLAAAGMAGYQPAFFSAVARTGVAVGTVVAIGSGPVFVGALRWVMTREPPPARWIAATAIALAGLLLVASGGEAVDTDGWGVVLALGAGLAYAVYAVSAAELARKGPSHESAGAVFMLAAALSVPLVASQDLSWLGTPAGAAMAAWQALGATVAAYLLFTAGLRTTEATHATTLALAEPVTATILALILLSERPPGAAWLGIGLITLGLVLTARDADGSLEPAAWVRSGKTRRGAT